jgi:CxxC motif-containing protein (DUF1111 family)
VLAGAKSSAAIPALLRAAVCCAFPMALGAEPLGYRAFADSRDPPAYAPLNAEDGAQFELGHAVFNTQWVPAATPGAERRDGLGPLYNASSCDECHNEGARGRGPRGAGPAPAPLIMQLERPGGGGAPDPSYGHVLNTAALPGLAPEALVTISYRAIPGAYPDGTAWSLRAPSYEVSRLQYGPLAPDTVLKPRLAPPLFGVGLLELVPQEAVLVPAVHRASAVHGAPAWQSYRGVRTLGRFGWQGASVSIRDQTTKAFSREMGLTSRDIPTDDCTRVQTDCLSARDGGSPEVADELLDAVVAFQRSLAVPATEAKAASGLKSRASMRNFFERLGCADCHRISLPVRFRDADGREHIGTIEPCTDLLLHDLGAGLADTDASGRAVPSRWRTAPLWGIGHHTRAGEPQSLLHDGRARSIEEAILWHHGEAEPARRAFEQSNAGQRQALMAWLETL